MASFKEMLTARTGQVFLNALKLADPFEYPVIGFKNSIPDFQNKQIILDQHFPVDNYTNILNMPGGFVYLDTVSVVYNHTELGVTQELGFHVVLLKDGFYLAVRIDTFQRAFLDNHLIWASSDDSCSSC